MGGVYVVDTSFHGSGHSSTFNSCVISAKSTGAQNNMHVLVYNENLRCAVVIAPTATVSELKSKVASQTSSAQGTVIWPSESQVLTLRGTALSDDGTLHEQGVEDRDRVYLTRRSAADASGDSNRGSSSSSLEIALATFDQCSTLLDAYVESISRGGTVHQEVRQPVSIVGTPATNPHGSLATRVRSFLRSCLSA